MPIAAEARRAPGPAKGRWIFLGAITLGAVLFGGLLGAVVGSDTLLPDWLPPLGHRWILRKYPYLPAAAAALLLLLASLVLRFADRRPREWRRYYLVALILSVHTFTVPGLRSLNHIVVATFAALWLMDLTRRPGARLTPSRLPLLVGAWFGIMALSVVNSGPSSLRLLVTEIKGVLIFLLVLHALETWADVRFFIGVILVISTLSAVVGLVQEAVFMTTGQLWVGKVDWRTKQLLLQRGGPLGLEIWLRPPGFLGFSQAMANALAVAAAMGVALVMTPGRQRHRGWLALALALMVATLVATASKGANGGFILAALLAVALLHPRWLLPLLTVGVVGVPLAAYTHLRFKLQELAFELPRIGDLAFRIQVAREAFQGSLERHPILGAGLGKAYLYNPTPLNYEVHNAFLLALAETGLLGLLIFTALFAFVGVRLARKAWSTRDPGRRATLVGILAGMIALLVHMQADPFYHLQLTWFFLPLAEAAILTASRGDGGVKEGRDEA